jgi:transcriptional regulator with AAA-type ATPase domain
MVMSEDNSLVDELRERIQELEDKVEALRIGRRVLMNLIDALEKEKQEQLEKMAIQNEKLQKNNCRYARAIMYRNIRITELEDKLRTLLAGQNKTGHTFT